MRPLSSKIIAGLALLAAAAATLKAHDLFLRPASFFIKPGNPIVVRVLNGTFDRSEAVVTADRLRDLTLISPRGRSEISRENWKTAGTAAQLTVSAETAGTYLIGASTYPRTIRLDAKDFNQYLTEDGLPDVLAARKRAGEDKLGAHERYSKHVKALVQAGAPHTSGFDAVLGYPAELVALTNPYTLRPGDDLRVRAHVDGRAVANQVVLYGGRNVRGGRLPQRSVRTDGDGVAQIRLTTPGNWYVKFIHMEKVSGDSVDYESKWATLTFGVR